MSSDPVATAHSPFDRFDGLAGRVVDDEVHERCENVRRERLVRRRRNGLGAPDELRHAEHRADGRFLHHRDELVGERGENVLDRLRQHDELHALPRAETERARRLVLSAVHGENARADDLRDIRRGVERKRHHAGNEAGEVDEAQDHDRGDLDHAEKAVENNVELHHHRRRAEHGNVCAGEIPHDLVAAQTHERERERRDDRETYRYD